MEKALLRRATTKDIPAITELWKEMMDFHKTRDQFFTRAVDGEQVFSQYLEKNINSESACVYVAIVGGTIVGYCQGTIEKHPPMLTAGDYGQVLDFAVAADYRRTGVGERLCKSLQGWFILKGVNRLEVRHSEFNEAASRFWTKMGFRPFMKTLCREFGDGKIKNENRGSLDGSE